MPSDSKNTLIVNQADPYRTPTLQRFGTFRNLTQIGASLGNDISSVFGIPAGCDQGNSDPDFGCGRS